MDHVTVSLGWLTFGFTVLSAVIAAAAVYVKWCVDRAISAAFRTLKDEYVDRTFCNERHGAMWTGRRLLAGGD